MKVTAKVDRSKLVFNAKNTVNMMVSLEAPDLGKEFKRNPLSICATIDVSGSMAGDKLEHVKKSMYKLIDNLTDSDSLSLVFFDDRIRHVEFKNMDSASKEAMKREVASAYPGGSTDIGSALIKAIEMFKSHEGPSGSVERIMLLTDGQPNIGVVQAEGFVPIIRSARSGVSLSCFGYGDGYNEDLLSSISKEGKGSNYYVESPDNVSKVFAAELGGLLTCYAQGIVMKVKPHKGSEVANILNDFDVETKQDDDGELVTTILVDDIFHGEKRNVIIRFGSDKRDQALPRPVTIADIDVSYRKVKDNVAGIAAVKAKIVFVKDAGEASKEADKEVAEQVAILEAATVQVEAKKLADMGDFVKAKSLYSSAINNLRLVGTDMTEAYASGMDSMVGGFDPGSYSSAFGKSLCSTSAAAMSSRTTMYYGSSMGDAIADSSAGGETNQFMTDMVKDFTGSLPEQDQDDGKDKKPYKKAKISK